jgi:hypothetical protein|tara:strand:- start:613 stop:885 length:273 start_codon:yes stop_codon:yes gene_type:complete
MSLLSVNNYNELSRLQEISNSLSLHSNPVNVAQEATNLTIETIQGILEGLMRRINKMDTLPDDAKVIIGDMDSDNLHKLTWQLRRLHTYL